MLQFNQSKNKKSGQKSKILHSKMLLTGVSLVFLASGVEGVNVGNLTPNQGGHNLMGLDPNAGDEHPDKLLGQPVENHLNEDSSLVQNKIGKAYDDDDGKPLLRDSDLLSASTLTKENSFSRASVSLRPRASSSAGILFSRAPALIRSRASTGTGEMEAEAPAQPQDLQLAVSSFGLDPELDTAGQVKAVRAWDDKNYRKTGSWTSGGTAFRGDIVKNQYGAVGVVLHRLVDGSNHEVLTISESHGWRMNSVKQ